MKTNKILTYATTWKYLKNIMVREISHTKKGYLQFCSIYTECPEKSKFIETEKNVSSIWAWVGIACK